MIFFLKKKLSMLMVLSKIKNYMNEIFYTSNVTNRCLKILLVCCLAMSDILLQNLPANDLDQQLFKKILHAIRLVRSTWDQYGMTNEGCSFFSACWKVYVLTQFWSVSCLKRNFVKFWKRPTFFALGHVVSRCPCFYLKILFLFFVKKLEF